MPLWLRMRATQILPDSAELNVCCVLTRFGWALARVLKGERETSAKAAELNGWKLQSLRTPTFH